METAVEATQLQHHTHWHQSLPISWHICLGTQEYLANSILPSGQAMHLSVFPHLEAN
jgi:hypothetical protein